MGLITYLHSSIHREIHNSINDLVNIRASVRDTGFQGFLIVLQYCTSVSDCFCT